MQNIEGLGTFYLGKEIDLENMQPNDNPVLYNSKDLTTHAVCVGMTGSGKTGLCLSLLEEAIIDKVPIIAIDPKGDISNLLLSFKNLNKESFLPWVSQQEADQKGLSIDELAEKTSKSWKEGIESWGQTESRICTMHENADLRIYTPGSKDGLSVSLLSSFKTPGQDVINDDTLIQERIESTVTGLLSLVSSTESEVGTPAHTFLSTIFYQSWSNSEDLSLPDLITKILNPSFEKIGAMSLNSFFDEKKRTKLSMSLNSFYASPKFKSWSEGQPLDNIGSFLFGDKGKPQVSIFSIAHLDDKERMFFVSKLLNEISNWVRQQTGTTSLRALLYMDEIFGYFPPTENPPSKKPMLTLLKQARAHGLGVVLATQNPVDLDYKGLSNIGTWFIGRLQTENDKSRLLEGLASTTESSTEWNKIISNLSKRNFLLHSVHNPRPIVLESRWALSYLCGPLSGNQISTLMNPFKLSPNQSTVDSSKNTNSGINSKPIFGFGLVPKFLNNSESEKYSPKLGCTFSIHFTDSKNKIDSWTTNSFISSLFDQSFNESEVDQLGLEPQFIESTPNGQFAEIPGRAMEKKYYDQFIDDFKSYIQKNISAEIFAFEKEKICSNLGESENEFRGRLAHLLKEKRDLAIEQIQLKYKRKIEMYESRIDKSKVKLEKETQELSQQKTNAIADIGLSVLTAFIGGGRGGLLTKARSAQRGVGRISKEKSDLKRVEDELTDFEQDLEQLKLEIEEQIVEIESQYDPQTANLSKLMISAKKADMKCLWIGPAWVN